MKAYQSILITVFVSLVGLSVSSCEDIWSGVNGEGPVVSESRSLPDFHSVKNTGSATVYIKQGPQEDVLIEAQQNILDILSTEVRNGRLEIDFKENVGQHEGITIYVSVPEVKELWITGSGELTSTNMLKTEKLSVHVTGSGDADLEAEVDQLEANIVGSGNISVSGRARSLDYNISGSGEINSINMPAAEASVAVLGSGDCTLSVEEKLNVSIAGSGDVNYRGRPRISSSINGSGDVQQLN